MNTIAAKRLISGRTRSTAFLIVALLLFACGPTSMARSLPPPPSTLNLYPDALQLISGELGILAIGGRLYHTADGGRSWEDITPAGGAVVAGHFIAPDIGWAVLAPDLRAPYAGEALRLSVTYDGGRRWETLSASLPGRPTDAPVARVHLFFASPQEGWLVWRFAGSSNFRQGALFRTRDGGRTWERLAIPFGEPVFFADAQMGWTAGGPAGDGLYETSDGGGSWRRIEVRQPPGSDADARPLYGLPAVSNDTVVLPVTWRSGSAATTAFYQPTADTGDWKLSATAPALSVRQSPPRDLPIPAVEEILVAHDGVLWALAADHNPEARGAGAAFAVAPPSGLSRTESAAWRVESEGVCEEGACRQEARLLRTDDAGRTWVHLGRPAGFESVRRSSVSPEHLDAATATTLFAGQGFDKCEIATTDQLATWSTASPYRAVNLYIGGASRACANRALSASLLRTLRAQGWVFIPTWVGPQAPCTSLSVRMSADPAIAYQQGLSEGNAALARAGELEIANEDGSGAIIYYDLEYFAASNTACLLATQAFMTGWTERIKAAGSLAGVYSTGCVLNGQAGNIPRPDAIWAAHWIYSGYSSDASVWDVYCVSNSHWANRQRLRQYTGGHNETWGGVTLNIDSNVLDGPVALPRSSVPPTSTPTATVTPTATATATSTATPTLTPTRTTDSPHRRIWLPLIHR